VSKLSHMEAVIEGLAALIANLNLKYFKLLFINPKGRNLEFSLGKLKLADIQYIVCAAIIHLS
ncbi:MAG: hypothetical protein JSU60_05245, partial [Nitrospirota bacterium]